MQFWDSENPAFRSNYVGFDEIFFDTKREILGELCETFG